jgi:hypothetical protein
MSAKRKPKFKVGQVVFSEMHNRYLRIVESKLQKDEWLYRFDGVPMFWKEKNLSPLSEKGARPMTNDKQAPHADPPCCAHLNVKPLHEHLLAAPSRPAPAPGLLPELADEARELLNKAKASDSGWKVLTGREIVKLLSVLDTSLAMRAALAGPVPPQPTQDETQKWRELLWLNHARYTPYVHMPYGDDGEMQCCGIDFKRQSVEEISEYLMRRAGAPAVEDAPRCDKPYQPVGGLPGEPPEFCKRDKGHSGRCDTGEDATPRTPLHEALEQLIIDMRAIGKMLGDHPLASVCEDYAKRAALAASTTQGSEAK